MINIATCITTFINSIPDDDLHFRCLVFLKYTLHCINTVLPSIHSTQLVNMLSPMTVVAQLAEHCTRLAGSRARPLAGGPEVRFFRKWSQYIPKSMTLTVENLLLPNVFYFMEFLRRKEDSRIRRRDFITCFYMHGCLWVSYSSVVNSHKASVTRDVECTSEKFNSSLCGYLWLVEQFLNNLENTNPEWLWKKKVALLTVVITTQFPGISN